MKRFFTFVLLSSILLSCTSNESFTFPSIDGAFFLRSSYILEVAVDGNSDGIFSTDLMEEINCLGDGLQFTPGEEVANPTFYGISLGTLDDGNGTITQRIGCSIGDGLFPTYQQFDNEIYLLYGEQVEIIGTLSSDGNTLTFTIPRAQLYALATNTSSNTILDPDGNIIPYEGDAIVTYTRQ